MAPECLRRTQLSEVSWLSIPHSWSGDCKAASLVICRWQNCVCVRGNPFPHPIPLDAFGASILVPLALATRRLDSPLLCSPKNS